MIKVFYANQDAIFGFIGKIFFLFSFLSLLFIHLNKNFSFKFIILHSSCSGLTEAAYQLIHFEVYAEWCCDKCLASKDIPMVKFKP